MPGPSQFLGNLIIHPRFIIGKLKFRKFVYSSNVKGPNHYTEQPTLSVGPVLVHIEGLSAESGGATITT
jgi:hypothetical protein